MSLGTAAVGNSERVHEAINLGEKSIGLREGRAEEQIQMLALSHHNVALAALTCGQLEKADAFIEKSMEISAETCQSMTPEQKMYVRRFPSRQISRVALPLLTKDLRNQGHGLQKHLLQGQYSLGAGDEGGSPRVSCQSTPGALADFRGDTSILGLRVLEARPGVGSGGLEKGRVRRFPPPCTADMAPTLCSC
jgi:hypothetical protein